MSGCNRSYLTCLNHLLLSINESGTTLPHTSTRLGCSTDCSTPMSRDNLHSFDKQLVCIYILHRCYHLRHILLQGRRDCKAKRVVCVWDKGKRLCDASDGWVKRDNVWSIIFCCWSMGVWGGEQDYVIEFDECIDFRLRWVGNIVGSEKRNMMRDAFLRDDYSHFMG